MLNNTDSEYIYKVFGLKLHTDIYFPELVSSSGAGDVDVIYGKTPMEINEAKIKTETYQISKRKLLFSVKDVGHFYVEKGKKIIVQPDRHAEKSTIRLYILGTAFGALLLQRGMLPIHGSSVVVDGQCIVFTGASGAGKSTLSSAFHRRGHLFLADDVSAINFNKEGTPWVQPGYPQQKLREDSMTAMGSYMNHRILIDAESGKYAVPVQSEYANAPVRLSAICELKEDDCLYPEIVRVSGIEKLETLMRNIYRAPLAACFGEKTVFFNQCIAIAKDIAFYRLIRPKSLLSLEQQIVLIMDSLKSDKFKRA